MVTESKESYSDIQRRICFDCVSFKHYLETSEDIHDLENKITLIETL